MGRKRAADPNPACSSAEAINLMHFCAAEIGFFIWKMAPRAVKLQSIKLIDKQRMIDKQHQLWCIKNNVINCLPSISLRALLVYLRQRCFQLKNNNFEAWMCQSVLTSTWRIYLSLFLETFWTTQKVFFSSVLTDFTATPPQLKFFETFSSFFSLENESDFLTFLCCLKSSRGNRLPPLFSHFFPRADSQRTTKWGWKMPMYNVLSIEWRRVSDCFLS